MPADIPLGPLEAAIQRDEIECGNFSHIGFLEFYSSFDFISCESVFIYDVDFQQKTSYLKVRLRNLFQSYCPY